MVEAYEASTTVMITIIRSSHNMFVVRIYATSVTVAWLSDYVKQGNCKKFFSNSSKSSKETNSCRVSLRFVICNLALKEVLLSQWLTFKLLGITYLVRKNMFKLLLFHGPLAEWRNATCNAVLKLQGSGREWVPPDEVDDIMAIFFTQMYLVIQQWNNERMIQKVI